MGKIRVLVCDDSALMRRTLKNIIERDPLLEVVGTARDGKDAIAKAEELKPDVITLDINMPKMDGLTALKILVEKAIAPVIMVSSLTQEGAPITLEALEIGAFDYVPKPGGTVSLNLEEIAAELIAKIKAAARQGTAKRLARKKPRISPLSLRIKRPERTVAPQAVKKPSFKALRELPPYAAVAIGISTGGPKTIFDVLPALPADLPAAVFLVQHMPPAFTASYAERLDKNCTLKVIHAETGLPVKPGCCFVGKGGYHLTVMRKVKGDLIIRCTRSPKHLFMPSVDVMMHSVLEIFGPLTVGVLMTGMVFFKTREDWENFGRRLYPALEKGAREVVFNWEFQKKDGTPFWAEVITVPVEKIRGAWLVLSTIRDITRQKKEHLKLKDETRTLKNRLSFSQERLEQERRFLIDLIENLPVGIGIFREGRLTYRNSSFEKTLKNYPALSSWLEDLLFTGQEKAIFEKDEDRFLAHFRSLEGGSG